MIDRTPEPPRRAADPPREPAEAEERLRAANAIFENAVEGIAQLDPSGRHVAVNRAYARMLNRGPAELLGTPWLDVVHPEDRERAAAAQDQLSAAGRAEVDLRLARPDGPALRVHVRVLATEAGSACFLSDVAVRKSVEETREPGLDGLIQAQKLQAIGQLAAGIAHEINNPVGYILSNLATTKRYFSDLLSLLGEADAALRRAAQGEPAAAVRDGFEARRRAVHPEYLAEDFAKAIADSIDGARKITRILRSLREFSHGDEGAMMPTDLNAAIDGAIRLCWNALKYKTTVERRFSPLPPILGHPQMISQAFLNLLVHAAHAIETRGTITISTHAEPGEAVVRIRDTGRDITPEALARISEAFVSAKDADSGPEFGLYVARRIVQAHRGTIGVRSMPGEGTEFTVRFPAGPPREPAA